jgi:hypothetical protein
MTEEKILEILRDHLPEKALPYCLELWRNTPFELRISKTRQTKVGDFSCRTGHPPRITLNRDLNPYLFLATFVHEVSHLHVHRKYGNRLEAHGDVWRATFQQLLRPLLTAEFFPEDILPALLRHMEEPRASTFTDSELTSAFRRYDPDALHHITLRTLEEGSVFKLQGRYFKKGKLRRSRFLCREVNSKRNYLVPVDALVSDVQLSLL